MSTEQMLQELIATAEVLLRDGEAWHPGVKKNARRALSSLKNAAACAALERCSA